MKKTVKKNKKCQNESDKVEKGLNLSSNLSSLAECLAPENGISEPTKIVGGAKPRVGGSVRNSESRSLNYTKVFFVESE